MNENTMARTKDPRPDPGSHIQVECFLLCDFARTENGKLYVVGGGWDDIVLQELPLEYSAYLAIKLVLPGEALVESNVIQIKLLDTSGHELGEPVFESSFQGPPVANFKEIDGRGTRAVVLMGVAVQMAIVEPGRFVLRLVVNGETTAETSFAVAVALPS